MPPDIRLDIFKWTKGFKLYATKDQRSNNPRLVRPGYSEAYLDTKPIKKNSKYLSRVGSLMRSITSPRTLKVVK